METAAKLPHELFRIIVCNAPLVSIDVLVKDEEGRLLVGLRRNRPAQNTWFVPGGRIRKDERISCAFRRICKMELGISAELSDAKFSGVFEHIHPDNGLNEPGYGTHYVVLGYRLLLSSRDLRLPEDQHAVYRWLTATEILADPSVHERTKDYCRGNASAL